MQHQSIVALRFPYAEVSCTCGNWYSGYDVTDMDAIDLLEQINLDFVRHLRVDFGVCPQCGSADVVPGVHRDPDLPWMMCQECRAGWRAP